ncbi:MAG: hypothetical protein ACOYYU_17055 [Chloroflexota bacterium]
MQSRLQALRSAQRAEVNAQNALASARDAEWEFHNMLLGVKTQVAAQYGADSDQVSAGSTYQVQALGLKKKSERKAPGRKAKPSA